MTPFAPATSHRIDDVGDGLLRKDLRRDALIGAAVVAKPAFVHDPAREPAVYRALLTPLGIGARCHASGPDWVEVERVPGVELWQVGDVATWVAVAAWTAGLHARLTAAAALAGAAGPAGPGNDGGVPLLAHDAALAARWRARAAGAGVPAVVLDAHRRAAERLSRSAPVVIHGDLYAANVLVRAQAGRVEVYPVDWELAGRGPAVLDVAALTAGRWPAAARQAMARAYFDAAGRPGGSWEEWSADLDAARLLVCVQWLGWAPGWTPPAEHRHDWLGEALQLAARS